MYIYIYIYVRRSGGAKYLVRPGRYICIKRHILYIHTYAYVYSYRHTSIYVRGPGGAKYLVWSERRVCI